MWEHWCPAGHTVHVDTDTRLYDPVGVVIISGTYIPGPGIYLTRENMAGSNPVIIPYNKVVNRRLITLYGIIIWSLLPYFS